MKSLSKFWVRTVLLFTWFSLFSNSEIFAQASISGVINSYSKVLHVNPGSNSVVVDSLLNFSLGDKVLLIQMKGADIDESQSASFGTITSINNAGNYEFQTICDINGTTIKFEHSFKKTYDPTGYVQIIQVQEYGNAQLNGDLTAQPWNGHDGGVLVLECETLTLNGHNIDVTGKGFRGGDALLSGPNCVFISDASYFTSLSNPDALAKKGEGISDFIMGKECGRGPLATGGGGGNNHNGGGSGGANFGAGGMGGQRVKQSTFLCGSEPGLFSHNLKSHYSTGRVFLGGGGGAGHGNNAGLVGESGLNGGGIVFLKSKVVISNLDSILANGEESSSNATGDGAGGGGAGGAIIYDVDNLIGLLTINVEGSKGIDTDNSGSSNCSGPGGGGGAGFIGYVQSSIPGGVNAMIQGGDAGVVATTSQSNCTVGGSNGGAAGLFGGFETGYTIMEGDSIFSQDFIVVTSCDPYTSPSGTYVWDSTGIYWDTITLGTTCDSIVQVDLTIPNIDTAVTVSGVTLTAIDAGAQYQWYNCENFTPINGETNQSFKATNSGIYAVEVIKNGCSKFSDCHQVSINSIEENYLQEIEMYPNPVRGQLSIHIPLTLTEVDLKVVSSTGTYVHGQRLFGGENLVSMNVNPGVYVIQLTSTNGLVTFKSIVVIP